jgi:hypothetical protein
VADHFRSRGYEVLSENDEQTRAMFGIPKGGKAADIEIRVSPHRVALINVPRSPIEQRPEARVFEGVSASYRRPFPCR